MHSTVHSTGLDRCQTVKIPIRFIFKAVYKEGILCVRAAPATVNVKQIVPIMTKFGTRG